MDKAIPSVKDLRERLSTESEQAEIDAINESDMSKEEKKAAIKEVKEKYTKARKYYIKQLDLAYELPEAMATIDYLKSILSEGVQGTLSVLFEAAPGKADMKSMNGTIDEEGNLNCSTNDAGGCSYGKHQISTNTGKMEEFIDYLYENIETEYIAEVLEEAGGWEAAQEGDTAFVRAWLELSSDPYLEEASTAFLKQDYDIVRDEVLGEYGMDIDKMSLAVQEAVFSTRTQSGGTFEGILGPTIAEYNMLPANERTEERFINILYDKRADYIANSNRIAPDMKAKILNTRLPAERFVALTLLNLQNNAGLYNSTPQDSSNSNEEGISWL